MGDEALLMCASVSSVRSIVETVCVLCRLEVMSCAPLRPWSAPVVVDWALLAADWAVVASALGLLAFALRLIFTRDQ